MNIVETLLGLAGPPISQQAASILGEPEEGVNKAMGAAIPSVLGALLGKSGGAASLDGLLDLFKGSAAGDVGEQLGGLLGGDDNREVKASTGILEGIFGGNLNQIIDLISKTTGIKLDSAGGIMAIVATLVGKFFGNKATHEGLNGQGLASLLQDQKANILSALPAGAGSILGIADLPRIEMPKVDVPKPAPAPASTAELDLPSAGGTNWLLPAVGAALVAGLIWWFTRPTQTVTDIQQGIESTASLTKKNLAEAGEGAKDGAEAAGEATGHAMNHAEKAVTSRVDKALPDGTKISFSSDSIEAQLVGFVEDKSKPVDERTWFDFRNLNFETDSAMLKPGATDEITNLAAIMKAYPNVKLKIGGYTDNTGDAGTNHKLSQARAETVMVAIKDEGIKADRLEAEGYGSEHPIASNDTEEGRAKNRRIAVRVTAK